MTIGLITFIVIVILVNIMMLIQLRSNQIRAQKTSKVLVDQIEHILDDNDIEEAKLKEELKDEYVAKAKAIAYFLNNDSEKINNAKEIEKICNLIKVDEINIFNENGVIYAGNVEEYYGVSFDSGEQIGYFKPMLENKTLTMCQDLTENTVKFKLMMYAIVWDESGKNMIQVGIEPIRLIEELKKNEISEVVNKMPSYEGLEILVADKKTLQIIGATSADFINDNLKEIGIDIEGKNLSKDYNFNCQINSVPSYCTAHEHEDGIIVVVNDRRVVNRNIIITIGVVAIYLAIAFVVLNIIVGKMSKSVLEANKTATTDKLTGLLNRRGYENTVIGIADIRQNWIYADIDVNGLKGVNDNLGHEAGDEMIKGMADCMVKALGQKAELFRNGGDEFVAILFIQPEELPAVKENFEKTISEWSGKLVKSLSASVGYVSRSEFPDKSIEEIAKIADERMYADKEAYYKRTGIERRK